VTTSFSPILSVATGEVLRIDIRIDDSMWAGLFDRLEVHRSRSGSSGPYEELTGEFWSPARLLIFSRPYVINGKVLSLLLNEQTAIDITFAGVDPIAGSSLATQIQTQGLGFLLSFISGADIALETVQPGAAASIRVLESDAAGVFGLQTVEPSSVVFGQNARPLLVAGQQNYIFYDPNGSKEFFYRTRFRNSLTNGVSDYSDPFSGKSTTTLDPSNLILGTIDLVDLSGKPASNVHVLVFNRFNGALVSGMGVAGGSADVLTDENGHAEFNLVRGTVITMAIAGTPLARDVTVPTDPTLTTFRLLDPAVGGQDVFAVQIPNIEFAVRRTL